MGASPITQAHAPQLSIDARFGHRTKTGDE